MLSHSKAEDTSPSPENKIITAKTIILLLYHVWVLESKYILHILNFFVFFLHHLFKSYEILKLYLLSYKYNVLHMATRIKVQSDINEKNIYIIV